MRELERAQARDQPCRRDRRQRGDRQLAFHAFDRLRERRAQLIERIEHHGRQPLPGRREHHLPRLAMEQTQAQALFELLDLVAHCRLGHVQLVRGPGEAAQPGRSFEGTDGGQGRQRL